MPARSQHRHDNHGSTHGNNGYAPMELGAATAAAAATEGFRGKCYLCGEVGHMQHECPKAKGKCK